MKNAKKTTMAIQKEGNVMLATATQEDHLVVSVMLRLDSVSAGICTRDASVTDA